MAECQHPNRILSELHRKALSGRAWGRESGWIQLSFNRMVNKIPLASETGI